MNATLPVAFISCILSLMRTLSVATGMAPAAALMREQCRLNCLGLLHLNTLGGSPRHNAKLADWVRPEKPACIVPSEPMNSDLRPNDLKPLTATLTDRCYRRELLNPRNLQLHILTFTCNAFSHYILTPSDPFAHVLCNCPSFLL